MSTTSRHGFTLAELLTVVVLGAVLILASYQVLITNSRIHSANNAHIQGQQALRAGLDVLVGELREISPVDGDLLAMQDGSITIRSQRGFGVVCSASLLSSPPQLRVIRVGPWFESGDSVVVYAENEPTRIADDDWLQGVVQAVDTTVVCGGNQAQDLAIPGLTAAGDTVRIGAPVRAFAEFTYALYEHDGDSFLGRRARGSMDPDLLVGPLVDTNGLEFRYLDSLGAVTTVEADVSQIEVTLRYMSKGIRNAEGDLVSDSLVTRVHPRN
jgi:prepilin-type N-terminal cleavage/methylation domain-containing protein